MATNDNLRQASVRAATGTAYAYNDDWLALFRAAGITTGGFNDRMLAYLNSRMGTTYRDVNDAMRAFATSQGFTSWGAMGTFDASGTPAAPANINAPSISGANYYTGTTLTADPGLWSGSPASTYTYQWKRDGVNIGSATSQTYTLVSADETKTITVAVTATNTQGNASATSAGIVAAALPVAPVNTVAPSISGSANTGQTLTASTGTWTGTPTPTYTYQWFWFDTVTPISGATSSTYVPVSGDIGHTLAVNVTATNSQAAVSASSAATAAVSTVTTYAPVATATSVPSLIGPNLYKVMSRTRHYAPQAISACKIAVANFAVNLGQTTLIETGPGYAMTVAASIERLDGTVIPLLFSGASTGVVADGDLLYSDVATVTIPAGEFFVRMWRYNSNNSCVVSQNLNDTTLGEGTVAAVGGSETNLTGVSGALSPNSDYRCPPAAILGVTSQRSFAIIGDSRTEGGAETSGSGFDHGEFARAVGRKFPYINLGIGNDRATTFVASHSKRAELANLCSDVVIALGVNDFGIGRSAAQLLADYATIRGYFPGKTLYHYTLPPFAVTGTYDTLGGQTAWSNDSRRVSFNGTLRAGIAGVTVLEMADAIESARDSGKFRVDQGALTTDGTHENTLGNVINSGYVSGLLADAVPASFTFTDVTSATTSTVYTSNSITVSGIDTVAPISVTGGTYAINGGSYVSTIGLVRNGDTVAVRVTSSTAGTTATDAVLTIGGVSDTYTVTTGAGADLTPDAFTFTDVTGGTTSTTYTSNTITVSGIDAATAISITGGTYSKNGGAYTSTSGTVVNGDTVAVRVTSSSSGSTAVNCTLTIGGVSDTYTVTTAAGPAKLIDFSAMSTAADITAAGVNNFTRGSVATYMDVSGVMQQVTGSTPRLDWDPVSHAPLGLMMEETSTNSLLNSLLNGTNLATQTVAVSNGSDVCITFYGSGTITLSGAATATITGSGTGARTVWSGLMTGTSLTLTVSGTVKWAQLEKGVNYPTSYIPTGATAVTRATEECYMDGTNFSSWFNASAGTFIAEGDSASTIKVIMSAAKRNTQTDMMTIQRSNTSAAKVDIVAANTNVASLTMTGGAAIKVAFAYAANDFAASSNGGTVQTDTSGAVPTGIDALHFGHRVFGNDVLQGHVKKITYYSTRLSNAQLQALTT